MALKLCVAGVHGQGPDKVLICPDQNFVLMLPDACQIRALAVRPLGGRQGVGGGEECAGRRPRRTAHACAMVKFHGQDYKSLKAAAAASGALFEDPVFPASNACVCAPAAPACALGPSGHGCPRRPSPGRRALARISCVRAAGRHGRVVGAERGSLSGAVHDHRH